jgi:phosphatidylserine decarboxylase
MNKYHSMKLHREGYNIIMIALLMVGALLFIIKTWLPAIFIIALIAAVGLMLFVLQFFRHPKRVPPKLDDALFYAPADGKVVVMEERVEEEYLKGKRLMLSIFMSPTDVHCNRVPVSGTVKYVQHHPGKYLVAWHPKSSTDNERTTIAIESEGQTFVGRQIAGAMARRIRTYLKVGAEVQQGAELGFIKFGSRVDVFLPLDAELKVKLGDHVRSGVDVIAEV